MGCSGSTSSTNRATLSAMRGAPQLGQKPRRSPEAPTVGATEGDQLLGVTRLAVHPQKAMVQPTTFEVILELALHIAEQFTALLR